MEDYHVSTDSDPEFYYDHLLERKTPESRNVGSSQEVNSVASEGDNNLSTPDISSSQGNSAREMVADAIPGSRDSDYPDSMHSTNSRRNSSIISTDNNEEVDAPPNYLLQQENANSDSDSDSIAANLVSFIKS